MRLKRPLSSDRSTRSLLNFLLRSILFVWSFESFCSFCLFCLNYFWFEIVFEIVFFTLFAPFVCRLIRFRMHAECLCVCVCECLRMWLERHWPARPDARTPWMSCSIWPIQIEFGANRIVFSIKPPDCLPPSKPVRAKAFLFSSSLSFRSLGDPPDSRFGSNSKNRNSLVSILCVYEIHLNIMSVTKLLKRLRRSTFLLSLNSIRFMIFSHHFQCKMHLKVVVPKCCLSLSLVRGRRFARCPD